MGNCNVTQSCSWILTAVCFSGDNVSLWTRVRSSSLGDNFWISLTALRLFCYSHFVIRQDHGFDSVLHANLISCWVGFLLSYFYKSNSSYLFCKLWLCRVLIAACAVWQMLTDFHGRAKQSFALWEQRRSSKAWALSVVPHFFSLPAACRLFSRGVIFTRALLSLRKNGGLLVVYSWLKEAYACMCLCVQAVDWVAITVTDFPVVTHLHKST